MVQEIDFPQPRREPYRRSIRVTALVNALFPDITTNPKTLQSFQDFLERGSLPPDDQIIIEQVVRGQLNGLSGEIFGTKNKGDMLPGQPVNIAFRVLSPAIQNPH